MVRKIVFSKPTIGNWAALDEALVNEWYGGDFEPTVALFEWPTEPPSLSIGIHEDGDMINVTEARERGYHVGRRYGYGGSVGVYGPSIPLFTLWFEPTDADFSLETLSRRSGEAVVSVLEQYGVDAVYDHIGDIKFVVDGNQYKAVANAPVQLHDTDLWGITVSIIWGGLSDRVQETLDAAVRVPPEKFEDKKEKTVTGRMKPLSLEFDQFGSDVSKSEFLDELIDATTSEFVGPNATIREVQPDTLFDYIDQTTGFYESDTWVKRRATSRMCRKWNEEDTVGVAAYKSRKLLKASLILEGETIKDALFTGDFFIRPHPTVTAEGAPEMIDRALVGLNVSDRESISEAIQTVFDTPGFEMPMVQPEDVVETVVHAGENTMSVSEYLEQHV